MDNFRDAKIISGMFNTFTQGSSIIAGGYLRDNHLGRLPKDIDILVEWESKADYNEAYILADRLGYVVKDYSEGYGYQEDTDLRCVFKLVSNDLWDGRLPIDIIFTNVPVLTRVKNFPVTLSQIWYDGTQVHRSEAFDKAVATKTLCFGEQVKEDYYNRMMSYFPDYKVELNAYKRRD